MLWFDLPEEVEPRYYPEEAAPKKERPGLQIIVVGDDNVKRVKIIGDELTKLANPETNDVPIDKIKDVVKDADEEDAGTKYFFRKIVGGGLDKPDESELIGVDPELKMDDIYDHVKATSGGINKPDEEVKLVKIVGDVVQMK